MNPSPNERNVHLPDILYHTEPTLFARDKWHHVGVTLDKVGAAYTIKFYQDGEFLGQGTASGTIGGHGTDFSIPGRGMPVGYHALAGMGMYTRVLTEAEMREAFRLMNVEGEGCANWLKQI